MQKTESDIYHRFIYSMHKYTYIYYDDHPAAGKKSWILARCSGPCDLPLLSLFLLFGEYKTRWNGWMDGWCLWQRWRRTFFFTICTMHWNAALAIGISTTLIENKHLVCPLTQAFLMGYSRVPGCPPLEPPPLIEPKRKHTGPLSKTALCVTDTALAG